MAKEHIKMSGSDMIRLRIHLGLNQQEFAEASGLGIRSIQKFELGEFRIPEGVARVVLALEPIPYETRWSVLTKAVADTLVGWTTKTTGWEVNISKEDAEEVATLLPGRGKPILLYVRRIVARAPHREVWLEAKNPQLDTLGAAD